MAQLGNEEQRAAATADAALLPALGCYTDHGSTQLFTHMYIRAQTSNVKLLEMFKAARVKKLYFKRH